MTGIITPEDCNVKGLVLINYFSFLCFNYNYLTLQQSHGKKANTFIGMDTFGNLLQQGTASGGVPTPRRYRILPADDIRIARYRR